MLFVLSPAKKLDYDSPQPINVEATQPLYIDQAAGLIDVLKEKSPDDIAKLMKLSDSLARLNVDRYQSWEKKFDLDNSRPAIFAFNGDVYEGMQAVDFNKGDLQFAQEHLLILSGLYGVLRPLDLMQPYRLEMGTKLATDNAQNLYEYWGSTMAEYINERLAHHKTKVLVNLASNEYFKSVDQKVLKHPIVNCIFQENRDGKYKIISFNAKRARGVMARLAIKNQAQTIDDLKEYDVDGYVFDEKASNDTELYFRKG